MKTKFPKKSSSAPAPITAGPYATNRAVADKRAIAERRSQANDGILHKLAIEVRGAKKRLLDFQKDVANIDSYAPHDPYEVRMRRVDHAREIYVTLLGEYFDASESARVDRMRAVVAREPGGVDYVEPAI